MIVQTIDLKETRQVVFNVNNVNRLKLNNQTIWVMCNFTIQCERADNSTIPLQFVVKGMSDEICEIKILNDDNFTPIIISDGSQQTIDLNSTVSTSPIIQFKNVEFVHPNYIINVGAGNYTYSIKNLEILDFQPENTLFTSQFLAKNILGNITIPARFQDINLETTFVAYEHSGYDNTDYVIDTDLSSINLDFTVSRNMVPFKRLSKEKLPQNTTCHNAVLSSDNSQSIPAIGVYSNAIVWSRNSNLQNYDLSIPNGVTIIPKTTFEKTKFNSITIPSTVSNIGEQAFSASTTNLTFLQSANTQINIPRAGGALGVGTGMLYYKNARSGTIRTDNIIIANYDYEADNFNATVLHLDGTDWKLETPVVTASNNIISWSAITGAVKYSIGYSTTTSNYTYVDTTNTSFYLSQLPLTSGTTYNIVVVAVPVENSSVNIKSNKSIAIQYTA